MFPPSYLCTSIKNVRRLPEESAYGMSRGARQDYWRVSLQNSWYSGVGADIFYESRTMADTFAQWELVSVSSLLQRVGPNTPFIVKQIAEKKINGPATYYTDQPSPVPSWQVLMESAVQVAAISLRFPTLAAASIYAPGMTFKFVDLFGTIPSAPADNTMLINTIISNYASPGGGPGAAPPGQDFPPGDYQPQPEEPSPSPTPSQTLPNPETSAPLSEFESVGGFSEQIAAGKYGNPGGLYVGQSGGWYTYETDPNVPGGLDYYLEGIGDPYHKTGDQLILKSLAQILGVGGSDAYGTVGQPVQQGMWWTITDGGAAGFYYTVPSDYPYYPAGTFMPNMVGQSVQWFGFYEGQKSIFHLIGSTVEF